MWRCPCPMMPGTTRDAQVLLRGIPGYAPSCDTWLLSWIQHILCYFLTTELSPVQGLWFYLQLSCAVWRVGYKSESKAILALCSSGLYHSAGGHCICHDHLFLSTLLTKNNCFKSLPSLAGITQRLFLCNFCGRIIMQWASTLLPGHSSWPIFLLVIMYHWRHTGFLFQ